VDQASALEAARRGREEGYGWLFETYKRPLYRFIRRHRDLDADAANDVLQAAFIRIFRGLVELREDARFEPWMLRIARREALRALERRRRPGHEPLEDELDRACVAAERSAEQHEYEELLEQIRALAPEVGPEAIRETALRYYFREPPCTTEELAAELGVPHATVRKRLFSFRNKLREMLRREGRLPA
jgi:RNA polymerase sigma-70 factor (ECF subfamily)